MNIKSRLEDLFDNVKFACFGIDFKTNKKIPIYKYLNPIFNRNIYICVTETCVEFGYFKIVYLDYDCYNNQIIECEMKIYWDRYEYVDLVVIPSTVEDAVWYMEKYTHMEIVK